MPETLTTALNTAKNTLNAGDAFIWLYELDIDGTNAARITPYQSNVTIYETVSGAIVSHVFYAYPCNRPKLESDSRGTLTKVDLEIGNVSLEVQKYINSNDVTARTFRILKAHSANLGSATSATPFIRADRYQVLSIEANDTNITVHLGHYSLMRKDCPGRLYDRNRCPKVIDGAECAFDLALAATKGAQTGLSNGYDLSLVSTTTCDKGLTTQNGCMAHGEYESNAGMPAYHKNGRRFGGFPSIVKGKAF